VRILKPGQTVTLHEHEGQPIEGRIVQVTLYDDLSTRYEVRWWSEGAPVSEYFSRGELHTDSPEHLDVSGGE
jgi:hypothetical protein